MFMKKYIISVLLHAAMWSGVYFGVYQGVSAVANLLAVFLVISSILMLFTQFYCHVYLESNFHTIKSSFDENDYGSWWSRLVSASSMLIALTLIAFGGGGWIVVGIMLGVGVLLQAWLFNRIKEIDLTLDS